MGEIHSGATPPRKILKIGLEAWPDVGEMGNLGGGWGRKKKKKSGGKEKIFFLLEKIFL